MSSKTKRSRCSLLIAAFWVSVSLSGFTVAEELKTYKKNGLEFTVEVPESASPGEQLELVLKLSVPKGFHIYGAKDKTMPTKLKLEGCEGLTVSSPDVPGGIRHAKAGTVNYWLEGKTSIRSKVTVAENASGECKITGELKFMICNALSCRPPAKVHFECAIVINANGQRVDTEIEFEKPVRVKAGDTFISTEEPGYASPFLADVDGDGKKDLLVGQYNGGKIKVYPGNGHGEFAEGRWLKADGEVAEVPGVW